MNEDGYQVWIDGGDRIVDFFNEAYGGKRGAREAARSYAEEQQEEGCEDWTIYYAGIDQFGNLMRLCDLDESGFDYDDSTFDDWAR